MRRNKLAVFGFVFTGLTLGSAFAAPSAVAATTPNYAMAATHIHLDGKTVSNPQHIIAKDPWSKAETTWVPIYYLQEALHQVGFETKWDGVDLTFTKYPANWTFGSPLGNPEADPVVAPKGDMQISLVNGGPPSMNLPEVVAKDPASGVNTTYAPIYYLDNVLTQYFKMGATWNGVSDIWNLTSQSYNPITMTSYASVSEAASEIAEIQRANTYLAFGPNSQSVNLGLGITAKEDAGLGHQGFQWHEGNWTVEVLYYTENGGGKQVAENVVSYLHSHMLPAPHDHGILIVSSTDPYTTAFPSKEIIAWQEGNKVYELQQTGDPTAALQTVVHGKQG